MIRALIAAAILLLVLLAQMPTGGPAGAQEVTPTPDPFVVFPWGLPSLAGSPTAPALPDPPVPTATPEPSATAVTGPAEPGLRPITLGGWMRIVELTPTLGDEIAANGRIWVVFEHQIAGIPEGWRLGYRAYGDYRTRDGRSCEDCYLAEGLFGNNRGYISGRATVTWTSRPDADVRYQAIQLCITAIDPTTNEIRISNLCEERRAS